MDIKALFKELSTEERHKLAEKVGTSTEYLRHCTSDRRRPSPKLCQKLVQAEPRLTLAELRPDLWGEEVLAMA
jgi:DNA-binding transcriptional regulator YdaS (Cro superfamily)